MATLTEGLVEEYIPVIRYHGFNTNKNITVGGSSAVDMSGSTGIFKTPTGAITLGSGAISVTGAMTITANIDASGATLKAKKNVLASSGNTTMTAAMSGSVMLLDGAGTDYVLPAISASDIGMEFWFVVTVTATDQTITAGAADLLTGGVACSSTTAGGNDAFSPDVTDDLIITMNGTTQGGIIGSTWHLIAISATRWYCDGTTIGSGTLITPFS